MSFKLTREQIDSCINTLEEQFKRTPCDHTRRHTKAWAERSSINWDDLLDLLDEHGGFCDCEVVLNLPSNEDLELSDDPAPGDGQNPFLIPKSFPSQDESKIYDRVLIAEKELANNCYAEKGEMLVPAPKGAKPRKRTRKSVHYFVGLQSGLPAEVGVIAQHGGITAGELARMARNSGLDELKSFGVREAAFCLMKIAKIPVGKPIAVHFNEIKGLSSVREELRIHKILIRG